MSDENKPAVKLADVVHTNEHGFNYISLSKLTGKPIKDVIGNLSMETGEVTFTLSYVVLKDGTKFMVEGEHDFPYLTWDDVPNMDEETLDRLYQEMNPD